MRADQIRITGARGAAAFPRRARGHTALGHAPGARVAVVGGAHEVPAAGVVGATRRTCGGVDLAARAESLHASLGPHARQPRVARAAGMAWRAQPAEAQAAFAEPAGTPRRPHTFAATTAGMIRLARQPLGARRHAALGEPAGTSERTAAREAGVARAIRAARLALAADALAAPGAHVRTPLGPEAREPFGARPGVVAALPRTRQRDAALRRGAAPLRTTAAEARVA